MEMVSRLQVSQYGESFFHSLDPRVKMGLALIFSLIGPLIESQLMLGILTITAMSYLILAGQGRILMFIGAFFVISMVMYLFVEALILSRPPKVMEYLKLTLTMLPIMCIGLSFRTRGISFSQLVWNRSSSFQRFVKSMSMKNQINR